MDTLKVGDELGVPAPVTHDLRRQGDQYFLRVGFPLAPNRGWWDRLFRGRTVKSVDVTDALMRR